MDRSIRQSNIELLKIVAIVFIILSHSNPEGDISVNISAINLNFETSFQMHVLQFFHNLGNIGNDIFLVCSCWFLLESNRVKFNKIISLILDALFVSISLLALFLCIGYRFPNYYIIKQLFPTTFANNWFLSCYLLLYMLHPAINIIINKMDDKKLIETAILFLLLYGGYYFLLRNDGLFYSRIIGFIMIYLLTAMIKRIQLYDKFSRKKLIFVASICIVCVVIIDVIAAVMGDKLRIEIFSRWDDFINPFFMGLAFSMFGIAKITKVKYSKVINYISSLSLIIYISHANRIMRDYVRYSIFDYIFNKFTYRFLLGWCLGFFAFLCLFGLMFSVVYHHTLGKISIIAGKAIVSKVERLREYAWKKVSEK